MSAFDDLQSQLLKSIAQRASRRPARGGSRFTRRWRGARSRRGLLLFAIPLVFVAAAAAAIVTQSGENPANRLLDRVLMLTHTGSLNGPCEGVGGRRRAALSDEAPDRRITAVLPQLATAPPRPPAPKIVAMVEHDSGGAVLARTIREVRVPGGVTLIVWVAHGQGGFTPIDPQRCRSARLAKLAQLRPNAHDLLRQKVAHMIEDMPDTDPGLQSFSLFHSENGSVGGGASFPLLPKDRALPTGVLFTGYSCGRPSPSHQSRCSPVLYGGIAGPATAYLTVAPAPRARSHGRRVHRRVAVVQGLFAFTLPRNSGPETITQRTSSGRGLSTGPLWIR